MRKMVPPIAALLALAVLPGLAQTGGGGLKGSGSGDSGGEQPFSGNVFRQDELNQQLDPEGSSQYQIGLTFLQDEKYDEAILHLNAAVAMKPNDAGAWFYLGYAHQQRAAKLHAEPHGDDLDTAMRNYRHALRLDPDLKPAHQFLGVLFLEEHDLESAVGQASALARICSSGCEERTALDAAIATYKP